MRIFDRENWKKLCNRPNVVLKFTRHDCRHILEEKDGRLNLYKDEVQADFANCRYYLVNPYYDLCGHAGNGWGQDLSVQGKIRTQSKNSIIVVYFKVCMVITKSDLSLNRLLRYIKDSVDYEKFFSPYDLSDFKSGDRFSGYETDQRCSVFRGFLEDVRGKISADPGIHSVIREYTEHYNKQKLIDDIYANLPELSITEYFPSSRVRIDIMEKSIKMSGVFPEGRKEGES